MSEPKDLRAFIRGNLTQFESRNRFAKGRLIKKCEKENYHEMIPRIESLKKEFNYMLEQPEEPIKLKNKINKYTKKLDILLSYVNQIDADNIKTRDKLILNRIKSKVNPNKFSKNKGLNYLSSDIEEVEKSSNLIIEKIQDIYLQDFDFEINKYGLNEREDDLLDNLNLDENLNDICNLVDNYNNLNAEIGNFLQNNYKGTKDQVNYLISKKENINSYIELSSELKNSVLKSKFESLNNLIEIYSKRSFFDINNVNEHEVEKGYKEDSNSRNDNDNNQETNLNSINELINFAIQAYNDCQNKKLKEVCAEIGITKGEVIYPH